MVGRGGRKRHSKAEARSRAARCRRRGIAAAAAREAAALRGVLHIRVAQPPTIGPAVVGQEKNVCVASSCRVAAGTATDATWSTTQRQIPTPPCAHSGTIATWGTDAPCSRKRRSSRPTNGGGARPRPAGAQTRQHRATLASAAPRGRGVEDLSARRRASAVTSSRAGANAVPRANGSMTRRQALRDLVASSARVATWGTAKGGRLRNRRARRPPGRGARNQDPVIDRRA